MNPRYVPAVEDSFPTPPVRVTAPLPPPPPVVVQDSTRVRTPVAECIVGSEITTQYQEAQVQYTEYCTNSTPLNESTNTTISLRRSTGHAVQVTQGQCSTRTRTPSVLECGTIPGTKRFHECESFSSSDDSTIATHDKESTRGKVAKNTSTSCTRSSSTSNKKKKLETIKECGEALMMMARKAGEKRLSSKTLRKQVEDVAFDEIVFVGKSMGLNPEMWENEEPAEEDGKLAAIDYHK